VDQKKELTMPDNNNIVHCLLNDIWSKGDLALLESTMDDEFIGHTSPHDTTIPNVEAYGQRIALFKSIFPEITFTVDDVISADNKIAVRWTADVKDDHHITPTDQSTGEPISIGGMTMIRLKNDKIIEIWENWDALSMLESTSSTDVIKGLSLSI
jgi:predicted ester cyclase